MDSSVTLYIPTLNSAKRLPGLLGALTRSRCRELTAEVLVVDGGSTDTTRQVAAEWGAAVVNNPKVHVASARRIAAETAKGDILISIDSDCIPPVDWLSKIIAHFDDPCVSGVGGPYVCSHPTTDVERYSARVFEDIMQFPTEPMWVRDVAMRGTFVEGNCAFRRKCLLAVGNYRDVFTNHAEGVDVFWRLLRSGSLLLFDPSLAVEHLGYPKTVRDMMMRNYHFGWSSTKLAKYCLGKQRVDWALYVKLIRAMGGALFARQSGDQRVALLGSAQLGALIVGKVVSSICLRHLNV